MWSVFILITFFYSECIEYDRLELIDSYKMFKDLIEDPS